MAVEGTSIEGLLVVRWETHEDDRGFFRQTHQRAELAAELGREVRFEQGNHARSRPGVLRGFHADPWDKLVYVVRGTAFCAVADIRHDSVTFGHVLTFELGDPPGQRVRLFVGEGLANAYCAISEVDYVYEVSQLWRPDAPRRAVAWDDPDLGVDWPVSAPILSPADRDNPSLRAAL